MFGIIIFVLGLMIGGFIGVMLMCLVQINQINKIESYYNSGGSHEECQKYNKDY